MKTITQLLALLIPALLTTKQFDTLNTIGNKLEIPEGTFTYKGKRIRWSLTLTRE